VARHELRSDDPGDDSATLEALASRPRLLEAAAQLTAVDEDSQFHLLMTGVVDGLVTMLPPTAAIADVLSGEVPESGSPRGQQRL
jgi:hypothetical protein